MKRILLVFLTVAAVLDVAVSQASDSDTFKARRDLLMDSLGGGVAVLYGATQSPGIVASNFIQESNFYYLTGVSEPGAALILAPGERGIREILYLRPRDPDVENWDGRREPLGDSLERATGFQEVRRTTRLGRDLSELIQRSKKGVFLGPVVSVDDDIPPALRQLQDATVRIPGAALENMADLIPNMRRVKDADEIGKIQKAVDITGLGLIDAMQSVQPGMFEYQLQSVVEHRYKMEGAQFLGFPTILASGANTTVLHYGTNDQVIKSGELVLIDTGAAWEHYSADITRTIPVDGRFTDRQRELYELVMQAADLAIEKVRVGADYHSDVHMTAKSFLDAAGYGEYFIHGTGHFLGLDVHDAGNKELPLKAGVVITVEPGIYIPEEGIGIRIEDDILVTPDGPVMLSRGIPRTVQEIEAAMAR